MKFFTILALFGGIEALRLHSHSHLPAHNVHNVAQVQLSTQHQVMNMMKAKRDVDLTPEQEKEIEAWVEEKLSTGDKEISKQEAKKGLEDFVKKYDMPPITKKEWDELDKIFNEIDTNDNGKLSLEELQAAMKAYEKEMESAFVQVKGMLGAKRDIELTPEQEKEVEAWIKDKLSTGDNEISKKEAKKGLEDFVKKYDMPPITDEEWDELDKIFNEVDTNGNGKLSLEELKAAWEANEKDMESAFIQVKNMMGAKRDVDLTEAQEDEIEAWVKDKLSTGDNEISKKEAKDGILAFAKKYDIPPPTKKEWKELEAVFDEVDTNGNGKISASELEAAWSAQQEEMKNDALVQIRTLTKSKRDMELTEEQEKEIEAWIKEKLSTGDKQISKKEAKDGIMAFAKANDIPPPSKEEWEELNKIFDQVDTNGNGKISASELEAAWKEYEKEEGDDDALLQVKNLIRSKAGRDVDLTDEQEDEIEAWIEDKLSSGDNEISWKEAKQGLKAFVKKYKMKPITKKEWKELRKMFKSVDTDKNGKLSASELEAAWKAQKEESD